MHSRSTRSRARISSRSTGIEARGRAGAPPRPAATAATKASRADFDQPAGGGAPHEVAGAHVEPVAGLQHLAGEVALAVQRRPRLARRGPRRTRSGTGRRRRGRRRAGSERPAACAHGRGHGRPGPAGGAQQRRGLRSIGDRRAAGRRRAGAARRSAARSRVGARQDDEAEPEGRDHRENPSPAWPPISVITTSPRRSPCVVEVGGERAGLGRDPPPKLLDSRRARRRAPARAGRGCGAARPRLTSLA